MVKIPKLFKSWKKKTKLKILLLPRSLSETHKCRPYSLKELKLKWIPVVKHRLTPDGCNPDTEHVSSFLYLLLLSLQKVDVLVPRLRTTRDVGQECVCPPGTCHTVTRAPLTPTRKTVSANGNSWSMKVWVKMAFFAIFPSSKRTCVFCLGEGSSGLQGLQSRGLKSACSRSVWSVWILEAGSVCQEWCFFFSFFWCVVFITRLLITPQVGSSHVICYMSQNWNVAFAHWAFFFCGQQRSMFDFSLIALSSLLRSCVPIGGFLLFTVVPGF